MTREPGQHETPDLAARLGDARVDIRADLDFSRHLLRGEPVYFARDPLTCQSHSLSVQDYEILIAIRRERKLSEIFQNLLADGSLTEDDEQRFYQFIVSLHQLNFLHLSVQDAKSLYRRNRLKLASRRRQFLMAPIFLRVGLLNPDTFLDRTVHWVRPLFTRWCFLLWCVLVLSGVAVAAAHWQRLIEPLNGLLAARNLAVMWISLVALKCCHELGHAYACKAFGGSVPEMGAYFIVCTPCAYVDTTSAWGFPHKRQRLAVCFAGMYVELAIAACAIFVWAATEPSLLNSAAYNVAVLAGVVTVAFNINPLMRFDGYYLLSDLLEVPNLRERSRSCVTGILKRLLGVRQDPGRDGGRVRLALLAYGLAQPLYRMSVILAISAMVASKVFLLGLFMAGAPFLPQGWGGPRPGGRGPL